MASFNRLFFTRIKIHAWRIFVFVLTALALSLGAVTAVGAARLADSGRFTVTKADSLYTDLDGDNRADPGDVLKYAVTITSLLPTTSTGIALLEDTGLFDDYLTYDPLSFNISPLAQDDTYDVIGNTLLDGGFSAPYPVAVHVQNLFANDYEWFNSMWTPGALGASIVSYTTPPHGSLLVNTSTGDFLYMPDAGYVGTDTFTYTVADPEGLSDTATVTINVNAQRVWYVKNDGVPGDGRSSSPFNTLSQAQTASTANDTIYVYHGDGSTTGLDSGIILKSGQRLIGAGAPLTVPVAINGGSSPTMLTGAGLAPLIDNTTAGGNGVSITNVSAEVRGLNIAGNTNAIDVTTNVAGTFSVELGNNIIRSAGVEGIDVNGGGSGSLNVNIHDNTVTATGNGIDIHRTAGTVAVTALNGNTIHGNTGGVGINVLGGGAGGRCSSTATPAPRLSIRSRVARPPLVNWGTASGRRA